MTRTVTVTKSGDLERHSDSVDDLRRVRRRRQDKARHWQPEPWPGPLKVAAAEPGPLWPLGTNLALALNGRLRMLC